MYSGYSMDAYLYGQPRADAINARNALPERGKCNSKNHVDRTFEFPDNSTGDSTLRGLERTDDLVHQPLHYNTGDIECIDAMKASMFALEFQGYLRGAAFKYLWRFRYKGRAEQDLDKAMWYLNKLIKEIANDSTTTD
jgi:hypothetical protein